MRVTVFRCRQWCGDAACGVRLEDWRRAGPRLCLYWLLATAQARLSQAPATAAATCLAIHLASKQGGPACLARPATPPTNRQIVNKYLSGRQRPRQSQQPTTTLQQTTQPVVWIQYCSQRSCKRQYASVGFDYFARIIT